jgi:hypothetical protein
MTDLIGVNGKKESGKDTAYGFIRQWANANELAAERRGFADLLKWSFARLFLPDCSREEAVIWCNELKNDSRVQISWGRIDQHETYTSVLHEISGRQALQRHGTEGGREIFGDDFWVDSILPKEGWEKNFQTSAFGSLISNGEPAEFAVITDLRFENEARRIKELGGQIWKIERQDHHDDDEHASEQPLPDELVDRVIVNNGVRMAPFHENVVRAMDEVFGERVRKFEEHPKYVGGPHPPGKHADEVEELS